MRWLIIGHSRQDHQNINHLISLVFVAILKPLNTASLVAWKGSLMQLKRLGMVSLVLSEIHPYSTESLLPPHRWDKTSLTPVTLTYLDWPGMSDYPEWTRSSVFLQMLDTTRTVYHLYRGGCRIDNQLNKCLSSL